MWELCLGFGRAACLVLELDAEGVQVERSIQGEMCYSDSARYNCLQVEVEVLQVQTYSVLNPKLEGRFHRGPPSSSASSLCIAACSASTIVSSLARSVQQAWT